MHLQCSSIRIDGRDITSARRTKLNEDFIGDQVALSVWL